MSLPRGRLPPPPVAVSREDRRPEDGLPPLLVSRVEEATEESEISPGRYAPELLPMEARATRLRLSLCSLPSSDVLESVDVVWWLPPFLILATLPRRLLSTSTKMLLSHLNHPYSLLSGLRLFSHSSRYFSYPSLNGSLTFDEKMSSPRGFKDGGMGARGFALLPDRGERERVLSEVEERLACTRGRGGRLTVGFAGELGELHAGVLPVDIGGGGGARKRRNGFRDHRRGGCFVLRYMLKYRSALLACGTNLVAGWVHRGQ